MKSLNVNYRLLTVKDDKIELTWNYESLIMQKGMLNGKGQGADCLTSFY